MHSLPPIPVNDRCESIHSISTANSNNGIDETIKTIGSLQSELAKIQNVRTTEENKRNSQREKRRVSGLRDIVASYGTAETMIDQWITKLSHRLQKTGEPTLVMGQTPFKDNNKMTGKIQMLQSMTEELHRGYVHDAQLAIRDRDHENQQLRAEIRLMHQRLEQQQHSKTQTPHPEMMVMNETITELKEKLQRATMKIDALERSANSERKKYNDKIYSMQNMIAESVADRRSQVQTLQETVDRQREVIQKLMADGSKAPKTSNHKKVREKGEEKREMNEHTKTNAIDSMESISTTIDTSPHLFQNVIAAFAEYTLTTRKPDEA